jgi:hypothetical protein
LTATYLGGKNYSYSIPHSFIEPLSQSANLSVTLLDLHHLLKEKEKAEKRIAYLQAKRLY